MDIENLYNSSAIKDLKADVENSNLKLITQEALKGDHLKGGYLKMGFRTEIRTRHMDFALNFALDTSILTEQFYRESAV